ncbi:MAG TPA: YdcF family protein [Nitrospinaceae bacterium]|jgi:hypothetical protein|nr:YdcF family protein [Nitrospinaceae bacterium]
MSKLFRLITIRERRVLTLSGWIVLLMTFGSVLFSIALFIHPFLAPIKSVGGDILVVEGWFPDYALKKVKDRFEKGPYKLLITVGGKYEIGHPLEQYKSAAEAAASRLNAQGVPLEKIISIPITIFPVKDRTYHKALVVKKRLNKMGFTNASIDIVSIGVHARRSWILFEKAFSSVDVGVIAIKPIEYDTTRWWLSSEGVRNVLSELIAYLYARFIFSPPSK